jgi:hypothetical protein
VVDLRDKEVARAVLESLTDVTHIASTAIHEKPELVAGWSSKDQIGMNNGMLRNVVEPIMRTASKITNGDRHLWLAAPGPPRRSRCSRRPCASLKVVGTP